MKAHTTFMGCISMLLVLVAMVNGHSWIACTDYQEENGAYWDKELCRAYPRYAEKYANKDSFGNDRGFDYRPQGGAPCRKDGSSPYSDSYPKAVYYPGQRVVITHPTKNHVSDTRCTSKYIPDHGNYIYAVQGDENSDPDMATFSANKIADLGLSPNGWAIDESVINSYPKPGYQNAPAFCENMDKAMATAAFDIPQTQNTGSHTFMWEWAFNGPQDIYTTCWEVDIVANKAERDRILANRGQSTDDAGTSTDTGGSNNGGGSNGGGSTGGATGGSCRGGIVNNPRYCKNGGTANMATCTCDCPSGYEGKRCQTKVQQGGSTGGGSTGGGSDNNYNGQGSLTLNGLQCTCDCACTKPARKSWPFYKSKPAEREIVFYKDVQIP